MKSTQVGALMPRYLARLLGSMIGMCVLLGSAKAQFVVVESTTQLRVGPANSAKSIGKVSKGEVLEYAGKAGKWHKVFLFSGEYRYVLASKASLQKGQPKIEPLLSGKMQELCGALDMAESASAALADRKYPRDTSRFADELSRLVDESKLKVIQKHGTSPFYAGTLKGKCASNSGPF